MKLLMGIVTDGTNVQYELPDNEDMLGGCIVGIVIESARKLSDGGKEDVLSWIDSICEQAKEELDKMMN